MTMQTRPLLVTVRGLAEGHGDGYSSTHVIQPDSVLYMKVFLSKCSLLKRSFGFPPRSLANCISFLLR